MIRFVNLAVILLLVLPGCRTPSDTPTATAVSQEVPPPATLDQVSWMTGYWTGEEDGTLMEEVWLPRRGNMMVGLHVDRFPSGRAFFEYLRIEEKGTSLIYIASPGGRTPTSFIATSVRDSAAVFENEQHDYPQKIEYRLDRSGRLHARISGETEGGEESTEWIWSRNTLPQP